MNKLRKRCFLLEDLIPLYELDVDLENEAHEDDKKEHVSRTRSCTLSIFKGCKEQKKQVGLGVIVCISHNRIESKGYPHTTPS